MGQNSNVFLLEREEMGERHDNEEWQHKIEYERELEELDEVESSEASSRKNLVLDRLVPGRERQRALRFSEMRHHTDGGYHFSLTQMYERHDDEYERHFARSSSLDVPSNDEASYEQEEQESEREGLEFER